MRRSLLAIVLLAAAGCVDVPDNVRAQFAGPGANDRSNYRPGRHGSAPPVEDAPAPKAAETPSAPAEEAPRASGDAGDAEPAVPDAAEPAAPAVADGGVS
ncbi:MAG: hypothetical protein KF850_36940 [Labilithrix sp.]|nr:hypothetical protein [Labilithrix sp.]